MTRGKQPSPRDRQPGEITERPFHSNTASAIFDLVSAMQKSRHGPIVLRPVGEDGWIATIAIDEGEIFAHEEPTRERAVVNLLHIVRSMALRDQQHHLTRAQRLTAAVGASFYLADESPSKGPR